MLEILPDFVARRQHAINSWAYTLAYTVLYKSIGCGRTDESLRYTEGRQANCVILSFDDPRRSECARQVGV